MIGAGLAGLGAADSLAGSGWEVEVLEARDRVGGRTWSRRLDNGATIEMGAEFVLPGNDRVLELAAELGLELWDKGMRYGVREPRGGAAVAPAAMAQALDALRAALASASSGGEISVRELLDGLEVDPAAREAICARAEISSASSAEQVPATDLAGIAHIGPEPAPSVAGGNQGLAVRLASRLGDSVRLGDPVVLVSASQAGVEVRAWSGKAYVADAAVVAVPARVAGRIAFEPRLPREKVEALAAVRYGHAAKLFVPLKEPVAPSAVMNVSERYWCWTATGDDNQPMPVVSCFAGSPAALERLRVARGPRTWLESLARLRRDLALEPDDAVLSTWADDLWAGAAYSVSPGPELTAALARPVGRLAFAGEHTGGEFSGLMEGALRSGRRAADELVAILGA